jgi:hypothetical protein
MTDQECYNSSNLSLGLFDCSVNGVDLADGDGVSVSGSNHITSDLNVVISELSNLGIVNTHDLVLLGGSKAKTGNEVDDEENQARAEERVGKTTDGVGQLVSKLDVVLVEPSSRNGGSTVKMSNVVTVQILVHCLND